MENSQVHTKPRVCEYCGEPISRIEAETIGLCRHCYMVELEKEFQNRLNREVLPYGKLVKGEEWAK